MGDNDEDEELKPSVEFITQKLVQQGVTMEQLVKALLMNHEEYEDDEEYNSDVKLSAAIDKLIPKFIEGKAFSDVKEFREMRKALAFYDGKGQINEFKSIFKNFICDSSMSIDVFTVSDIETEKLKSNVLKNIAYLISSFDEKNSELFSDLYIVDQLVQLRKKLDEVILKID